MPEELEIKLAVLSHDAVRRELARAGAQSVGRVLEQNHILDRSDGSLRENGCALRVRENLPTDGGAPTATLTYKGPIKGGPVKRRDEIEIAITDVGTTLELLEALGYETVLSFAKRRESYRLDVCKVELDEVPHLGRYVEIEGPDEPAISAVQRRLGLTQADPAPGTYVGMLVDYCARTGTDARNVTFPQ